MLWKQTIRYHLPKVICTSTLNTYETWVGNENGSRTDPSLVPSKLVLVCNMENVNLFLNSYTFQSWFPCGTLIFLSTYLDRLLMP